MIQKIVFIDLDDTTADFLGSDSFKERFDLSKMYEPEFFLNLKPVDGSLVAIRKLIQIGYDVQFLSQPVAESAYSYSEKVRWVGMYFPELITKINLTQDKGLFKGDYLIDDNSEKWKKKFEKNGGKFIHFNYKRDHKEMWEEIVGFLKGKMQNEIRSNT